VKFEVCQPDSDPDHWMEVAAPYAEQAATMIAEHLCKRDPEDFEVFERGAVLLVRRKHNAGKTLRFTVTVEQVPQFRAREES
jgi:hypothetical protein